METPKVVETVEPGENPSLGICCACTTDVEVRNVMWLPYRSPEPGMGCWGCFQCGLPMEGAVAVFCDNCTSELEAGRLTVQYCCLGAPARNRRIPIKGLEPFNHDLAKHPEASCEDFRQQLLAELARIDAQIAAPKGPQELNAELDRLAARKGPLLPFSLRQLEDGAVEIWRTVGPGNSELVGVITTDWAGIEMVIGDEKPDKSIDIGCPPGPIGLKIAFGGRP